MCTDCWSVRSQQQEQKKEANENEIFTAVNSSFFFALLLEMPQDAE